MEVNDFKLKFTEKIKFQFMKKEKQYFILVKCRPFFFLM